MAIFQMKKINNKKTFTLYYSFEQENLSISMVGVSLAKPRQVVDRQASNRSIRHSNVKITGIV